MRYRLLQIVAATGCGSSSPAAIDAAADIAIDARCVALQAGPVGGARPVQVHVPASYDECTPAPLVIMLHGYGATGAIEESYLKLTAQSDTRGFLYAYPDGTIDSSLKHFWNATDACCDLSGTGVDDSAYVSGLISEIQTRYNVDAKRVFLVGHSNGAFMSYRMACDHSDQIAAIASLAGAMWSDISRCMSPATVSVVQIHGTSDSTVIYGGGSFYGKAYPPAAATVGDWVTLDGCAATADTSPPALDLDTALAGAETTVTRYATGCRADGDVELWSIQGGGHIPPLSSNFAPAVVDFLLGHPKP